MYMHIISTNWYLGYVPYITHCRMVLHCVHLFLRLQSKC